MDAFMLKCEAILCPNDLSHCKTTENDERMTK